MKNKRQEKILEIIADHPVETQNELIERLAEAGIVCTQSTISRDIKQLHLIKEPWGDKSYRYTVSKSGGVSGSFSRLQRIMHECCLSCTPAKMMIVLKTMSGLADAAGAAIDAMGRPDMLGCVSGNDTVLIIMRDEAAARAFCSELQQMCNQ